MQIKESYIKRIIKEELQKLQENFSKPEESKIAHLTYVLLGKAREQFDDYLSDLPEGEEASDEFNELGDAVADAWMAADKILTGGETRDALPGLFENNGDCTQEEISNALDTISRCVMSREPTVPPGEAEKLGVMRPPVSPSPGSTIKSGGIRFVDEDIKK